MSVLSQIRHNISLESDRRKIELLASKRNEVQDALKIIHQGDENQRNVRKEENDDALNGNPEKNSSSDGYFFMSSWNNTSAMTKDTTASTNVTSSSLFLMDKEDTKDMLELKLKQVEKELFEVCSEVQGNMDITK